MSKELQDALQRLLVKLLEGVEKGSEFAVEQAPLVVQEYLAWGLASSIGYALLLFVTAGAVAYGYKRLWQFQQGDGEVMAPALVFFLPGTIIPLVFAITNLMRAVKIWVAPRVYLIDQLRQLIQGQ